MTNHNRIFDKQLQRQRFQQQKIDEDSLFLKKWCSDQILDRLSIIKKEFHNIVIDNFENKFTESYLKHAIIQNSIVTPETNVITDPEFIPYGYNSIDLFISNLHFHRLNDLPGSLIQINRALKPDGLFMASIFGGETLHELKACLQEAEMEIYGGLSARVFPFADIRDIGALLQRAQFKLPTVDKEKVTVSYKNLKSLLHDLRAMGESNTLYHRNKKLLGKAFWKRVEEIYFENFSEDNKILATFEIQFMMGWKEDTSQQKPLKPGSAKNNLAEALNSTEEKLPW
ncbi:MAG: methyltransferase domain-containing protein [Pseudomonadota bacterium]